MAVTCPRMTEQHRIRAVGIQRAPGFVGQRDITQIRATVQRESTITRKVHEFAAPRRHARLPCTGSGIVVLGHEVPVFAQLLRPVAPISRNHIPVFRRKAPWALPGCRTSWIALVSRDVTAPPEGDAFRLQAASVPCTTAGGVGAVPSCCH